MASKEPFAKAESSFKKGNFKKSIQLYTLAIEMDPTNAQYISQRGVAFFRLGMKEEALYDLNKALELEPDNPYRYSSRAFILSNMDRIDDAIKDYEKAIILDPEDAIAHNNLGLLHEKKGYAQKAKTLFNKADAIEGISTGIDHSINNQQSSNKLSSEVKRNDESYWSIVKKMFTDEETRNEFIRFIKNGFKVK